MFHVSLRLAQRSWTLGLALGFGVRGCELKAFAP